MGDDSKKQVSPIPIGGGPAVLRALDARYEELKAARRAALNLMEDAVAANRRADELIEELRREVETRKEAEEALRRNKARQEFLLQLSDRLRPLDDPVAIQGEAAQLLREHFHAGWCYYVEWDETGTVGLVNQDSTRPGLPSMVGVHDVSDAPEFTEFLRSGKLLNVSDFAQFPLFNPRIVERYAGMGIHSTLGVPLVKNGRLLATLSLNDSRPRSWSEDAVALVTEVAERTWAAVERARAEHTAQEYDRGLRVAADATHLGVWEWNLDTNLVAWNEHHYRLLGMEPGTGIVDSSDFFKRVHPQDREHLEEEIRQAVRETRVFDAVFRVVQDSGAVRWMSGYGRLSDNGEGKAITMSGVMLDITDRMRVEEDLRVSNERLRLLIESATDVSILTTDQNGIVNSWNSGSERIYGFADDEIIGQDVAILFTDEDRGRGEHIREQEEAVRSGRALDERWHKRKDGTLFFASGLTQPIGEGGTEGFVKIARDMTDRIRADRARREKELMQTLVNAQELERRRLARDLHDELGQQLTALRFKLDRVSDGAPKPLDGQIQEVKEIAKNIDQGVDFLAWELRPAALDDLGLIPALEKFAKEWSAYSGISAEVTASASAEHRFDPAVETALYRIVQEALNNIHKHANATNASVTVRTRRGKVVLVIDDDGRGFDSEDPAARSRGMGLVGMNERVHMIGGTLEIESQPGGGTTLYIKAPRGNADPVSQGTVN